MGELIEVLLIDSDGRARESATAVLASEAIPCHAFNSVDAFLRSPQVTRHACVLLDVSASEIDGLAGLDALHQLYDARTPVIAMVSTGAVQTAVESLRRGAKDALEKPLNPHQLISSVRRVIQSGGDRSTVACEPDDVRQRLRRVSERERELLSLICQGFSNKQLAGQLGISVRTVANHRAHLIQKMRAANTADLVRLTMLAQKS